MNNTSQNDFVNLNHYIRLYWKNWYVFIISVIFCIGVAIVYVKLASPVFLVTSNLLVQENESGGAGDLQNMMRNFSFNGILGASNNNIYDDLQLLSSFSMFRLVVKELGLNTSYQIKEFPKSIKCYQNSPLTVKTIPEIADTLVTPLTVKIKANSDGEIKAKIYRGYKKLGEGKSKVLPINISTTYGNFQIDTTAYYQPGTSFELKAVYRGYDYAAEILQEEVKVDLSSKKANVINVSIEETNRNKGKDILNSLINVYNASSNKQKNSIAENLISFLDDRIELIEKELNVIEKDIEIYKNIHSITDIEAEAKIIIEKSSDFKERLIEAETQYKVIEMVEDFLLKPENQYALVPLNIGLSDRTVLEGLQKYNDALLERMRLLRTTHSTSPVIEVINEQLAAMRVNMLATIGSIKSGFDLSRKDLKEQEDYFISRIKGMPTQEREFVNIKRQQLIKQELFVFLLQKREENSLSMSVNTPKAIVVDVAYNLHKPIKPKLMRTLAFAIFVGAMFAFAFIHARRYIKGKKIHREI